MQYWKHVKNSGRCSLLKISFFQTIVRRTVFQQWISTFTVFKTHTCKLKSKKYGNSSLTWYYQPNKNEQNSRWISYLQNWVNQKTPWNLVDLIAIFFLILYFLCHLFLWNRNAGSKNHELQLDWRGLCFKLHRIYYTSDNRCVLSYRDFNWKARASCCVLVSHLCIISPVVPSVFAGAAPENICQCVFDMQFSWWCYLSSIDSSDIDTWSELLVVDV